MNAWQLRTRYESGTQALSVPKLYVAQLGCAHIVSVVSPHTRSLSATCAICSYWLLGPGVPLRSCTRKQAHTHTHTHTHAAHVLLPIHNPRSGSLQTAASHRALSRSDASNMIRSSPSRPIKYAHTETEGGARTPYPAPSRHIKRREQGRRRAITARRTHRSQRHDSSGLDEPVNGGLLLGPIVEQGARRIHADLPVSLLVVVQLLTCESEGSSSARRVGAHASRLAA